MKGNTMTDMLQEYCDSRGVSMRVDRQAGIIHGVKLLGLESRNGRTYLPEALAGAARLYENAKVNVNHPKGNPAGPRDYQDRIGVIRRVTVRSDAGLFGDFYFNPKHALAEQLIWDAEHSPENVGFSHNVEARVGRRGDIVTVEAIMRVQSVDLVADPATTRGLFEGAAKETEKLHTETDLTKSMTLDELKRDFPELVEEARSDLAAECRRLREELDRFCAIEAANEKRLTARRVMQESGLPQTAGFAGERFMELLSAAPDEATMRALAEERVQFARALAGARPSENLGPQSRDQELVYAGRPLNNKSFVDAIT